MGHIDHLNNSQMCHSIFKYETYQNCLNLDIRVNTAAPKWFKVKYRNIEGYFFNLLLKNYNATTCKITLQTSWDRVNSTLFNP